jgi:hypothetical protein
LILEYKSKDNHTVRLYCLDLWTIQFAFPNYSLEEALNEIKYEEDTFSNYYSLKEIDKIECIKRYLTIFFFESTTLEYSKYEQQLHAAGLENTSVPWSEIFLIESIVDPCAISSVKERIGENNFNLFIKDLSGEENSDTEDLDEIYSEMLIYLVEEKDLKIAEIICDKAFQIFSPVSKSCDSESMR